MTQKLGSVFGNAGEDCEESCYLFCGQVSEIDGNTIHPSVKDNTIISSDNIATAYQHIWADKAQDIGWIEHEGEFHPYILLDEEDDIEALQGQGYIYQVAPNHFEAKNKHDGVATTYECHDPIIVNCGHSFAANIHTAMQYGLIVFIKKQDTSTEQTKALLANYSKDKLYSLNNHVHWYSRRISFNPMQA